jgi:hypothetical protein
MEKQAKFRDWLDFDRTRRELIYNLQISFEKVRRRTDLSGPLHSMKECSQLALSSSSSSLL